MRDVVLNIFTNSERTNERKQKRQKWEEGEKIETEEKAFPSVIHRWMVFRTTD